MKLRYLVLGVIGCMIGWNVFLIQRDQQLFATYDTCAKFTQHPDCPNKK